MRDTFTSKALLANLTYTFVEEVHYEPEYNVFLEIFSGFPALRDQIKTLLREVFHPYKNSYIVLEEFRSFFLKNLSLLLNHKLRIKGYWLIFDILFRFFSEEKDLNIKTAETIFSILDKTADIIDKKTFQEIALILKEVLKAISNLPEKYFLNFLENYYSFKKLISKFTKFGFFSEIEETCKSLLIRSYVLTYNLWKKLAEKHIDKLDLSSTGGKFVLESFYFEKMIKELMSKNFDLETLLSFPDHLDLLRQLKELIQFINSLDNSIFPEEKKLLFLFKLIEISILRLIHEELIREVNNNLIYLVNSKSFHNLDEFLVKFFKILKEKLHLYPWTALECIKNIGICILNKRDVYLAEVLINEIIKFGFQPPQIKGIDTNWKIKQNPNHLLNIKIWLDIFKVNPEWCSSLLSALILNLKLYGISIKDTDLFQREITALLNSPIKPVYNLVKQFCKILPIYYNEIGAEGLIRDFSTEVDEIFQRNDSLIHFLRKFVHIENSSLAVDFIRDILNYWLTLDGSFIKKYLPDEVYKKVITHEKEYHLKMQKLLKSLMKVLQKNDLKSILNEDINQIKIYIDGIEFDKVFKDKLYLVIFLYKLEYQKYYGVLEDIDTFLAQYSTEDFPFLSDLKGLLNNKKLDPLNKIDKMLTWLKELKESIILSSERFTPVEQILIKRHIAVDIPSMYGRYKEKKFDAIGLTFRIEYLINSLFEKILDNFNLRFVTKASFFKILKVLKVFRKALYIDGILSQKFDTYLNLLESSVKSYPLSYKQYLDIFRGLIEGVQHIVKAYYTSPFLKVFPLIFSTLNTEDILEKYKRCFKDLSNKEETYFCISEMLIREIIDNAFVLKYLDRFLKKIYDLLSSYADKVEAEDLNLLLSYDTRRTISLVHKPNPLVNDIIYLGGKGYNLTVIAKEGNINVKVPYGFILTTEIFRCYGLIKKYEELWKDYEAKIRDYIKILETLTGKKFGDKKNPLLLSIRSGSALSMPGMMNTILNVGANEGIIEGLAEISKNTWFAWDTYRRFIQSWAMSHGIPRDFFNNLMREHKRKYKVKKKKEFTGEQMRDLALLYKNSVRKLGVFIGDDPWEQLFKGIELILNSWHNYKANAYREIMQLSEEWGTAVIVQQMVFGNKTLSSGTGVTLTTSPVGKFSRIILWGDYTPYNQGEDIVSGLVNVYPISLEQRKIENREGPSLEEAFPEIYKSLLKFAYYLVYEKGWGHQEIEFTFESENPEDLYILQVRDIILREERNVDFFDKKLLDELKMIGKGIGVSGGLVSGRIVFSLEDILEFKSTKDPLILLRYDTVPDNIKEISLVDGILTARGGQTSHAAIVASRLGKVCVVGCEKLSINEFKKEAKINTHILKLGDWITLNGMSGQIFKGKVEKLIKGFSPV
ncbi:MAG: Phosphoenolpyruvate synthase/pyruvate phosphate dikinase [Thermodesulfobacterium sp.]|uniref:Phosphoenolpyruvate synthase/pyruvate phosphate dikinase n=1 Tax=Candidatus Thermodesulfobacterium syntrophicum TaxID=3060442 RepID=A0AAE3TFH1_9BACT|nr:Phosphoenolpyruvate synthase/pyruvate phosphate dikinase [Candidatus Thermodesulfobacterium syntrophicum]